MLNLLSTLFVYKEPANPELGFELLENEDKGKLNDQQPNSPGIPRANGPGQGGSVSPAGEGPNTAANVPAETVSTDLSASLQAVKQKFNIPVNQDVVIREFRIARKLNAFLVFIDGMVDKRLLNNSLFPRLMSEEIGGGLDGVLCSNGNVADYLIQNILPVHSVSKSSSLKDIVKQILNGVSALFIDGRGECILMETRGFEKRAVEAPKTENVIKGAQEAFTENLRTNISLVRRNLKSERLVTEMLHVGKTSDSNCAILYIDGLSNPQIVAEVKKRINAVDTDYILGEGMLENFIEDNSFMILPQTLSTERPDRITAFLLLGEVAVIVDGIPLAIAVPANFFQLLHSPEDAHLRWPYATFLRIIRILGAFIALLLPGLYCAVVLFHQEMLPTELLISIADSKEVVPFPTLVEILILEFSFELIREGSIRVPLVMGNTLGIVGALILGQAAVQAGLVSPVVVIVVSLTALGSFAIPDYSISLSFRILRFFFIFAGATLGFYGIAVLLFILVCVACSMKSFGVPFLAPIAPKTNGGGNMIFKWPVWTQTARADYLNTLNTKSQGNNQKKWINENPR